MTDPKDRVETLAKSKAGRMDERTRQGAEAPGTRLTVDRATVEQIIAEWPPAPKKVAGEMIERYGPPNEATPTLLIWHDNGPWKRTEVTADEREHRFPTAHTDFITQFIEYQVPIEKFSDIARFDGSVVPNRTTGEVFAACDLEAMNILSLNLMHEIVTGRRGVDEARKQYADSASAYMMNRPDPYTEELQFDVGGGATADPDEAIIAGSMARQAAEKAKDVLTRGDD